MDPKQQKLNSEDRLARLERWMWGDKAAEDQSMAQRMDRLEAWRIVIDLERAQFKAVLYGIGIGLGLTGFTSLLTFLKLFFGFDF